MGPLNVGVGLHVEQTFNTPGAMLIDVGHGFAKMHVHNKEESRL